MLEDDVSDVIRKALRGLEWSTARLAVACGIEVGDVEALLAGRRDGRLVRLIAPALGLDAEALEALPRYVPPALDHPAVTRLELPFGAVTVNAWLVDGGDRRLLVDSGCDPDSLVAAIERVTRVERITDVIVTHGHADHVGGLGLFDRRKVAIRGPAGGGGWNAFRIGDSLRLGAISVTARDAAGHATPALALEIHGLDVPVMAVGDALYAGSMGRCLDRSAYELAKRTLWGLLEGCDRATWLLCGHGPATRLDEEWRANPFLAAMRARGADGCDADLPNR